MGLIKALTSLRSLRPNFGRQLLAVETMPQDLIGCSNQQKLKALTAIGREKDFVVVFFLLFCGLMEGKYALICDMDIPKIQMVVHIFSGFALFMKLM